MIEYQAGRFALHQLGLLRVSRLLANGYCTLEEGVDSFRAFDAMASVDEQMNSIVSDDAFGLPRHAPDLTTRNSVTLASAVVGLQLVHANGCLIMFLV